MSVKYWIISSEIKRSDKHKIHMQTNSNQIEHTFYKRTKNN
jgi:hypothetical protein